MRLYCIALTVVVGSLRLSGAEIILLDRTDTTITLTTTTPKVTKIQAGRDTRIVLSLPKPGDGSRSFQIDPPSGPPAKVMTIQLDEALANELTAYTEGRVSGKRLEPVLSVRGIEATTKGVAGNEVLSATIEVPNDLTIIPDDSIDLEDYVATFQIVYLPKEDREGVLDSKSWCVFQGDQEEVCKEDRKSDKDARLLVVSGVTIAEDGSLLMTFSRANAWEVDEPVKFVYMPQDGRSSRNNQVTQKRLQIQSSSERQQRNERDQGRVIPATLSFQIKSVRKATTLMPRGRGNPIQLQAGASRAAQLAQLPAPITSRQFPLHLAFSSISSFAADKQAGARAFNFELDVNPDYGFLQIKRGLRTRWAHAPGVTVRATNQDTGDDENSIKAKWLLEFVRAIDSGLDGAKQLQRPVVRSIALRTGPSFEFSKDLGNRNFVIPSTLSLYLPKTWGGNRILLGELKTGWETGWTLNTDSNVLVSGVDPGPMSPKAELRVPVAVDQKIDRFFAGANATVHLAPRTNKQLESKLELEWSYRSLMRKELSIGTQKVAGTFNSEGSLRAALLALYPTLVIPADFLNPSTTFNLRVPKAVDGSRRYLNLKWVTGFANGFGFQMGYTRGEQAPTFQFVNRFDVGLNYRIGKK